MRVLIALDKFKEALGASEACAVVADAIHEAHPDWQLDLCPLADGGDGFVLALAARPEELRCAEVSGPLGEHQRVQASWALVEPARIVPSLRTRLEFPDAPLAILEMASCSGLALVPPHERDVLGSSSRGVGELISIARQSGAGNILLGVGGSATNDLGLGALAALGWRAFDENDREISPLVPRRFQEIARLQAPPSDRAATPPIWIACDVDNPLCGPLGATLTYGPQKGLSAADLMPLDAELRRLSELLADASGRPLALASKRGSGAAGGIAAGLMLATDARLVPGFELVSEWLDLDRRVEAADIVITGEGRFDDTSLRGKGPGGVVRSALARKKPTTVVAGQIQLALAPAGLVLAAITPGDTPLAEALPATARNLRETTLRLLP